jgi:hypothetical protein
MGFIVWNMCVYAGSSEVGYVQAPKNGFLKEILSSNLKNGVSKKANAMYAFIGNFRVVTDAP